mmetsp:Transcript_89835/g.225929  ORF Transcript_89835/g.225929 Transcript_89835/m.225929 type:complete len:254 (-) Transcript_89835:550-1311(-)
MPALLRGHLQAPRKPRAKPKQFQRSGRRGCAPPQDADVGELEVHWRAVGAGHACKQDLDQRRGGIAFHGHSSFPRVPRCVPHCRGSILRPTKLDSPHEVACGFSQGAGLREGPAHPLPVPLLVAGFARLEGFGVAEHEEGRAHRGRPYNPRGSAPAGGGGGARSEAPRADTDAVSSQRRRLGARPRIRRQQRRWRCCCAAAHTAGPSLLVCFPRDRLGFPWPRQRSRGRCLLRCRGSHGDAAAVAPWWRCLVV